MGHSYSGLTVSPNSPAVYQSIPESYRSSQPKWNAVDSHVLCRNKHLQTWSKDESCCFWKVIWKPFNKLLIHRIYSSHTAFVPLPRLCWKTVISWVFSLFFKLKAGLQSWHVLVCSSKQYNPMNEWMNEQRMEWMNEPVYKAEKLIVWGVGVLQQLYPIS